MRGNLTEGFSQNQIKLVAAAAMLLDHVGMELLPSCELLRVIGRLAFPVFAFCIAEGSRYTRRPARYLARITGLGLLCVAAYAGYAGILYGNVLITFALSLLVLYAFRFVRGQWAMGARGRLAGMAALLGSLTGAGVLCTVVPIDYGFWGIVLPLWGEVAAYLAGDRIPEGQARLGGFTAGLVALSWHLGGIQWFSLLSLPLLAGYNGARGARDFGRFFYWFYPAHLVLIGLVCMLL